MQKRPNAKQQQQTMITDTGRHSAGLADGPTEDPTCCYEILIVRAWFQPENIKTNDFGG